jgi:hypothetical protein
MIYPENVQLWKLFLAVQWVTLVTLLKYGNGFFWHGDFTSWVAKELTH